MKKYELVITPGDPDGIGPEVTAKALRHLEASLNHVSVLIIGSRAALPKRLGIPKKLSLRFQEPPLGASPGYQSAWSIKAATSYVMEAPGSRALVTGPISKERIQKAGFPYKGHTDFLADLTGTPAVTMMLANDLFRVALVTNHCALKDVSGNITPVALKTTIEHAINHCRSDLGVRNPRIAVLGLNPHAGEGGVLGEEEKTIIIPTLKRISRKWKGVHIGGPFPADSFFAVEAGSGKGRRHDVIIAQYHDQGLIPVKLSNFNQSMNMTLGLPIVRTSVDHGTAFDIAKRNKAHPGSMIYAIECALAYLKKRKPV